MESTIPEWKNRPLYYRAGKRFLDICISGCLLVVGAPVWLILLVLQKAFFGEIFFFQVRPGLNEIPFTIIKLKTMRDGDQSDQDRVTYWGKFLRKTSLDEFPQLLNVLKGEMSLIGPRPLLVEYLDRYTSEQRLRHKVKPGLNGLAQLQGRNTLDWESQFGKDLEYVKRANLLLDVALILLTPVSLLKSGVSTGRKHFNGKA